MDEKKTYTKYTVVYFYNAQDKEMTEKTITHSMKGSKWLRISQQKQQFLAFKFWGKIISNLEFYTQANYYCARYK